jgi:GT2 family glycosyltransferase
VATEAPLSPSRISVLIPVKDGADTLPQLLDALASQQTKLDVETFAIDSGSRDGSVELMKERGLRVESIASSAFDHGDTRNRAIAGTSGDIAVLLTQSRAGRGSSMPSRHPFPTRTSPVSMGVRSRARTAMSSRSDSSKVG